MNKDLTRPKLSPRLEFEYSDLRCIKIPSYENKPNSFFNVLFQTDNFVDSIKKDDDDINDDYDYSSLGIMLW